MINQLKSVLDNNEKVAGWKIHETYTVSDELFFIKEKIDMNRSKKVKYFDLTVYVDVADGDETFTGLASGKIHPTMTEEEVKVAVEDLAFSAQFAKNKQFSLVEGGDNTLQADVNDVISADLATVTKKISKEIFSNNVDGASLNSEEVFVNKIYHRIINSKGVDVSYISGSNVMEIITESPGKEEDVELFDMYEFAGDQGEGVAEIVKEQLEVTKYRAIAEKMPDITNTRVILRTMELKELLGYYIARSSAQVVYDKLSDYKVGDHIQGQKVKGDKLTIRLVPELENSTKSRPVDADGVELKEVELIKDGVLSIIHGNNQYASYLNQPVTGTIQNVVIQGGSMSYEEMTNQPYIEILSFSAFQSNILSGDFGGEIRLAKYFDGEKTTYFNGGALSANIKEVHSDMYLSKEIKQLNEYKGPKSMMFVGDIAGAK